MENELWDLFLETGEPMGYLLFIAERNKSGSGRTQEYDPAQPENLPSASL